MGNRIRTLALLAPMMLTAVEAAAQELKFVVPLSLANVEGIVRVDIHCSVSRLPLGRSERGHSINIMGTGFAQVLVSNAANLSQDVQVTVPLRGIDPPEAARSYFCGLSFVGQARTGARYIASPGNMRDLYYRAMGRNLVETFIEAVGNIPGPPRPPGPRGDTARCAKAAALLRAPSAGGRGSGLRQEEILKLCRGAETSDQPARCIERVAQSGKGVDGSSARWDLANAIALCQGTHDAAARLACYNREIRRGSQQAAILACQSAGASPR